MNYRAFLVALTTAVSMLAMLQQSSVQAQLDNSISSTGAEASLVEPIDLPFNSTQDRTTHLPDEREQSDSPDAARGVVGADQRIPVLTRQFPWSAIGRLEWQYDGQIIGTCTATLIDTSLLLTNAHCLTLPQQDASTGGITDVFVSAQQYSDLSNSNEVELKLVFKPSMIDGVSLDEATVLTYSAGWTEHTSAPADDWALLELDEALGDRYGYLGWRSLDLSDADVIGALAENTLVAGYAYDFPTAALREFGEPSATAGVDLQCSVLGLWAEGVLAETLVHDCDTNSGASGAPILAKFTDGKYYIIGLHARQLEMAQQVELPNGVSTQVVNGGVQVSRWSDHAFSALLSRKQ